MLALIPLFVVAQVTQAVPPSRGSATRAAAADAAAYQHEIEGWRAERVARLTADGGWLTVAGLFWLAPGANRFGADRANEIVLPAHSSPPHAGRFLHAGGRVTVEVDAGAPVTLDGKPVTRRELRDDAAGAPDVLALGALTMHVIVRGQRVGIRLKDQRSAARQAFKGVRWYPIRADLRVRARFVPRVPPEVLTVPTVLGTSEPMPSPGSAFFTLGGKSFRLDPVTEPGDPDLFFIFRDATSGRETYGGGRFLYAAPPAQPGGDIILDFNKAHSPPCAFTAYATCPLPPPQNRLPIAIEAGEMGVGHH